MSITKYYSWELIKDHYEPLHKNAWEILPMIDLVNHIISLRYSDRLYAFTSLDALIISIYKEIDKLSEALHIKYDQDSKDFLFSYYGEHSLEEQPEWKRRYEPSIVKDKFNQFITMIK
jgi:hypothetical protein